MYCTVHHRLDGLLPKAEEVTGRVTFAPELPTGDAWKVDDLDGKGPATILATKVIAYIENGDLMHDGTRGVELFAGGEGSNPPTARWTAHFHDLKVDGRPALLGEITFDAIPDGVVYLTDVQPVAGATPKGIGRW